MNTKFNGRFVSGSGDCDYLHLIDQSFSMINSTPELPYLKMLYKSETDMLSEGFIWGTGWWIQNSYGFTLGAVPFLSPLWFRKLQNSYDAFWRNIGDGKRRGCDGVSIEVSDEAYMYKFVAPDGALGDCVGPCGIAYKQGDGDARRHDWFYEGTAAGVNMEADILLFERNEEKIRKYMPLIQRSLNHIESTRDENGLFYVGNSANLLAPSYGGSYDKETDTIGKGYLTGVCVTYSAALKKCAELYHIIGDEENEKICRERLARNLEALPLLLTDEGYFVKSMDKDGTRHGVFGAEDYGYLEAVCNVDAIATGTVDDKTANSIYDKIASVPGIRPAGAICTNYPHLDDTLNSYKNHNKNPHSLGFKSGDWVDGGCWCTVEGRAVLAYMRLGKYEDAYKACRYYMDWAEEYRQDAPLSQWGYNTNNPWQSENDDHTECGRPVAIMIDNFASATCLLRGLYGYKADANGLTLTVQIPDSIDEYSQLKPVRFGGCDIYISYKKSDVVTAEINGTALACTGKEIFIPAEMLEAGKSAFVTIGGADPVKPSEDTRTFPAAAPEGLDARLTDIYADCAARLAVCTDALQKEMLSDILDTCLVSVERNELPFDRHNFRPMTDDKMTGIKDAYVKTAVELYNGYLKFMI